MDLSLTSNLSISTYIGSGFGNVMQGDWALTYQRETESTRISWQHMQETYVKDSVVQFFCKTSNKLDLERNICFLMFKSLTWKKRNKSAVNSR